MSSSLHNLWKQANRYRPTTSTGWQAPSQKSRLRSGNYGKCGRRSRGRLDERLGVPLVNASAKTDRPRARNRYTLGERRRVVALRALTLIRATRQARARTQKSSIV